MTLYVSISRDPSPYVLGEDCANPGVGIGDGSIRPDFQPRRTHAPDSAFVSGKQLLAVVLEQSELRVPLIAQGASNAEIQVAIDELEDALWQFVYVATLHEDGVEWSWSAEPAVPVWGPITAVSRRAHARVGSVSIPVNPNGA